eukprot:scaffold6813_cov123-Isochrysis_galbana.AAC.2
MRAHHRYDFAPARYPVVSPEPVHSALLTFSACLLPELRLMAWMGCECSKRPLWESQHPPLLPQQKAKTPVWVSHATPRPRL